MLAWFQNGKGRSSKNTYRAMDKKRSNYQGSIIAYRSNPIQQESSKSRSTH